MRRLRIAGYSVLVGIVALTFATVGA